MNFTVKIDLKSFPFQDGHDLGAGVGNGINTSNTLQIYLENDLPRYERIRGALNEQRIGMFEDFEIIES